MKIQLLKRTMNLRIFRDIIVLSREKGNMQVHPPPRGFRGGETSKENTFASFLGKYEIRRQKKINRNCRDIIRNEFPWV